jgi:hypothetical protein
MAIFADPLDAEPARSRSRSLSRQKRTSTGRDHPRHQAQGAILPTDTHGVDEAIHLADRAGRADHRDGEGV